MPVEDLLDQGKAGQGLNIDQVGPSVAVIVRPGAADHADLGNSAQDAI